VKPPKSTVAIIVDICNNRAAIRIFEMQSNDYIDGVGTEEAGKLVIVLWQSNWFYWYTKSLYVGHILKK